VATEKARAGVMEDDAREHLPATTSAAEAAADGAPEDALPAEPVVPKAGRKDRCLPTPSRWCPGRARKTAAASPAAASRRRSAYRRRRDRAGAAPTEEVSS
jgi:hypothetical protein